MNKKFLQMILESLDAIDDECAAGFASHGLEGDDADARYALEGIRRIATGLRKKVQLMANKTGIDSIDAMT